MASSDDIKWKKFVEIGETIHKLRGKERIIRAKLGIGLAEDIVESGYVKAKAERIIEFDQHFATICDYLDADVETIQAAARWYFMLEHARARLDESLFSITFDNKQDGVQSGGVCDVFNGSNTTRYFIKTHQNGPTNQNIKSLHPPDAIELFVYKLLELIGVGPEVHFMVPMHGTKRTVYIATKDANLTLLEHLDPSTASLTALLAMDLISRILCLSDCCDNTTNCGLVGDKPMIIDFRINPRNGGYSKPNILELFLSGNGEYNYLGLMRDAMKLSDEIKRGVVMQSLQAWDLLNNIDRAHSEIARFVERYRDIVSFTDTLSQYVSDIKSTVKVLQRHV
eukprot:jgi/Hompol1/2480/HPOL_006010-RA